MVPGDLWDTFSPPARVAVAVLPFALAMSVRLMFGRTRTAGWLITLSVVWFAMNIVMAPYSAQMRQDIRSLRSTFRVR